MFNTKLKTSIVNIQKFIFLVVVAIYEFIYVHILLYVLNIIAVHLFMYISVVRKFRSV